MRLIDMHCDTVGKVLDNEYRIQNPEVYDTEIYNGEADNTDLRNGSYAVTIPAMQKAGTTAQFFACFTNYGAAQNRYELCYHRALEMMDCLDMQIRRYPEELAHAYSYDEILENEKNGKISAVLTVEEGGILNGRIERLEEIYNRGVRVMTPMWNYENCLGYPNSRDTDVMCRGLKPFGREVVNRMTELGMIVDVSHASDGTFRDMVELSEGAVIASHSNCRALCNHPRNLTDDMIRELAGAGGVAGLNLYGQFLSGADESRVEAMTEHILHMIRVGGSEFPAIGTDLDGFDGMNYEDIRSAGDMEKLWLALKHKGLAESQLDKIWSENVLQVIRRIL